MRTTKKPGQDNPPEILRREARFTHREARFTHRKARFISLTDLINPLYDSDFRMKWRLWHFRVWYRWCLRAMGTQTHIACMHCGTLIHLEIMPMRKASDRGQLQPWAPEQGQILCLDCYDTGEDYRPEGYAEFQARVAAEDWVKDLSGAWELLSHAQFVYWKGPEVA